MLLCLIQLVKCLNYFLLYFISYGVLAGELDGKGLICKSMEIQLDIFDLNRAYEHKLSGGKDGLEIIKKDVGKYLTNENSIFINEIKINRKDLGAKNILLLEDNAKHLKILRNLKV